MVDLPPKTKQAQLKPETSVVIKTDKTQTVKKNDTKIPALPQDPDLVIIIAKGNTLGEISRKFTGTINNWKVILTYNNINNPKKIRIGQQIKIPPGLLLNRFKNSSEPIIMEPAKKKEMRAPLSSKQAESDRTVTAGDITQEESENENFESIFEE